MTSKLVLTAAIVALIAFIIVLILPSLYRPPRLKGARDVLAASKVLSLSPAGATAGESLQFDKNGIGPYTSVADGRVVRWEGDEIGWTTFSISSPHRRSCTEPADPFTENVCGRPLGIHFETKSGDLYIGDCYFGLLVAGPEGGLGEQVLGKVENRALHFTNHIDIDEENDIIYFTDTSKVYYIRDYMDLLLTQESSGRLIKYDKVRNESTVLMRNLAFPNGVALSKDKSFITIVESTRSRVWRYWLTGPKAGRQEIFAKLPGFPDNIRRNPKGEFWVALHAKNTPLNTLAVSWKLFGKILLKLFNFYQLEELLVGGQPHGIVVKLSETGEIVEILEDTYGKTLAFLSEAYEWDGKLYLGSILTPKIGVYNLSDLNA